MLYEIYGNSVLNMALRLFLMVKGEEKALMLTDPGSHVGEMSYQ